MCGLLKAEYMGSGATLVDGVRRWFQRRTSSSSKPINTTDAITNPNPNPNPNNNYYSDQSSGNCNKSKYDNNDGHVFFASDLSAQSSTSLQKEEDYHLQFQVEDDFDISGLKLIQVPKRADFRAPHHPPPIMDSQKKVPFSFYFVFQDLGIDLVSVFDFQWFEYGLVWWFSWALFG